MDTTKLDARQLKIKTYSKKKRKVCHEPRLHGEEVYRDSGYWISKKAAAVWSHRGDRQRNPTCYYLVSPSGDLLLSCEPRQDWRACLKLQRKEHRALELREHIASEMIPGIASEAERQYLRLRLATYRDEKLPCPHCSKVFDSIHLKHVHAPACLKARGGQHAPADFPQSTQEKEARAAISVLLADMERAALAGRSAEAGRLNRSLCRLEGFVDKAFWRYMVVPRIERACRLSWEGF